MDAEERQPEKHKRATKMKKGALNVLML
jgi:hypothetical protein